jgi:hypothetical protein
LGLVVSTGADTEAQANSTPPLPKLALVAGKTLVVDSFDSVSQWTTNPAAGVEITVSPDSGRHGRGLRLDFDFHGQRGYGIIHRSVDLDLPANYEFRFAVRGEAPTNTLEFKLVDTSGANVWWSNNPFFIFPREWRTIIRNKGQICFAWGPAGDRITTMYDSIPPHCRLGVDVHRVAAIEFAITTGSGGKGSVWIDDLSLTPLDADSPRRRNPPTEDEAQTQTYFEFQVEKPATMPAGTPMPSYPAELVHSGLAGEVQAQFVVRNSGKVDMGSFKVLKSNDDLFAQAVRRWLADVTFIPARIGSTAVHQLVQQRFQFSVSR